MKRSQQRPFSSSAVEINCHAPDSPQHQQTGAGGGLGPSLLQHPGTPPQGLGYSHNSHSERPPAVGERALLPQGLGAMDVGDGYEHCRKRALFSITHRYCTLGVHQHLLFLRDMGFMSLEPAYHSGLFQTRLLRAVPSPWNAGGGSAASRGFKKASSSQTVTATPVAFGGRQWGTSQNSSRDINTFEAGNTFGELQVPLVTFKKAKGIWLFW